MNRKGRNILMKLFFHPAAGDRSAAYASKRMQSLLASQRLACTPGMLELLQSELLHLVSRYLTPVKDKVTIQIEGEPPVLYIQIPVQKREKDKVK